LTFNEYLSNDYDALLSASNKITGNHHLSIDLLHYGIEDMSTKSNLQDIVDSGGARFYLIRIMMTQWRSQTGPFHRQFVKQHSEIDHYDRAEKEEVPFDFDHVNKLIEDLDWYDRELFKLFAAGDHNYSTLAKETGIPRTSIALTIKRVRKHLKKNL